MGVNELTIERDNCLRIAIVGIDGSGKSTCFKEVMEELSIEYLDKLSV